MAQKKTDIKRIAPDIKEFIDAEGKKWIQTSADDLLSLDELNEVLDGINRSIQSDEIVLARIDFQQVNREYYEAAVRLQKKLQKQTETLKKIIHESQKVIDRKNAKLKEMIEYIRKLHAVISYLNAGGEGGVLPSIQVSQPSQEAGPHAGKAEAATEAEYVETEEIDMPLD